jgi:hypothetical protein
MSKELLRYLLYNTASMLGLSDFKMFSFELINNLSLPHPTKVTGFSSLLANIPTY